MAGPIFPLFDGVWLPSLLLGLLLFVLSSLPRIPMVVLRFVFAVLGTWRVLYVGSLISVSFLLLTGLRIRCLTWGVSFSFRIVSVKA